jgi:hypothetical protein
MSENNSNNTANNNTTIGSIVSLVIVIGLGWYFFGGGLERQTTHSVQQIDVQVTQQVTDDAVKEYDIAKRNGTAMEAYVHAGFVAEAYLQAKDEANYKKWVAIRKSEAARAGMPDP